MKRIAAMIVLVSIAVVLPVRADLGYEVLEASVEMSDGVGLDLSLYTPLAPTPPGGFPLIVRQHGGGSSKDSEYDVRYALKAVHTNRFAVLMYSHRGHGGSGGVFDFFGRRSAADVSELLDWVPNARPQIDVSRTGMWGYSQGGGLSLLPAMTDPRIKAVAAGNTFDDLSHALNPNDCFKFSFATGIFALAYKSTASKTDDSVALRWGAQWNTDTEGVAVPVVDASGAVSVQSTDSETAGRSPATHVHGTPGTVYDTGLNVPVFWSNSWEDALFPADHGLGILADLESRGIPTHLWFASGGHEVPETHAADEAGKEHAMLEWFEEFLLGIDHGYASGARPKVEYAQRIPGGGWTHKTAPSWPVPGMSAEYGATPGGGLMPGAAPQSSLGTIVNTAASANLATEPILSNRAAPLVSNMPDSRNPADTLTFATDAAVAPLEFTGAPRVSIRYASTAQRVAQFNVKLWDERDGARRMITRGCLSDETPGDGVADFDLWPNSHVLAPGHRLVMTISTVDFPTFKPDTEPQASTLASATLTLNGVAS